MRNRKGVDPGSEREEKVGENWEEEGREILSKICCTTKTILNKRKIQNRKVFSINSRETEYLFKNLRKVFLSFDVYAGQLK